MGNHRVGLGDGECRRIYFLEDEVVLGQVAHLNVPKRDGVLVRAVDDHVRADLFHVVAIKAFVEVIPAADLGVGQVDRVDAVQTVGERT